ncbi:SET domain-containing protein [Paraburkholderia madseniana]|nr:SET domain-containing protein-lysine N-methyltransferase [Paraburkholderia madseniana]
MTHIAKQHFHLGFCSLCSPYEARRPLHEKIIAGSLCACRNSGLFWMALNADFVNAFAGPPLKPYPDSLPRTRIAVRRSAAHGRDVFATRGFFCDEFVCEYRGEQISWDEATRSHPRDPDNPDHAFYFGLGDGTMIDGAIGGNSAGWLNHSCSPNCEADDHDGRVLIHTIRTVPAAEELNIDYALAVDGRHTRSLRQRCACRCGSQNCRGSMPADKKKPPARPSFPRPTAT